MSRRTISFTLNGRPAAAEIGVHQNLTEVLQENFGLFGARESCGQGLCGCCTVLIDGEAVTSCLSLAVFADGATIETIEGLSHGDTLSPEQEAFIETGAFQCGYCTPAMLITARDIVMRLPDADDRRVRVELSGNMCRCTGYMGIVKAIRRVLDERKRAGA